MITIPSGARVLLATRPVDFRKGAHGLAALTVAMLGEDPFSGVVVVFRSRRADRVKILIWDASGLVLIWKQLQQGGFRWPPVVDGAMRLSAAIAHGEADAERRDPALKQERAAKRRANRGALPVHLPRIEVTLEPDDTACPCCRAPWW